MLSRGWWQSIGSVSDLPQANKKYCDKDDPTHLGYDEVPLVLRCD